MSGMWTLILVLALPFALGAGALWLDRVFRDESARSGFADAEVAEDVSSG